ncbi:hypothetical protein VTI74DRAFT_1878 [Chaetomium olivicolor]
MGAPGGPGTSSTSPLLTTTLEILDQCDEICQRLTIRCATQHPHDEPLTILLRNHIEALVADVQSLKFHISGLRLDIGTSDGDAFSTELIQTLDSIKIRLVETLALQDFHSHEERGGHDGALNTLFASTFILGANACPDAARAHYNEDKLIRIGLELKELVDEVLPASVRDKISQQDAFNLFLPKITRCFVKVERQFRPRYVHTYDSFLDAPYTIDVTTLPCSGSYAVVRKFNHRRNGEALAIKTFPKVFDDETTCKILREIGILEVCDHKNIVRLIEAFRTKDDGHSMHLVIAPWAPCTLQDFLHMSESVRATRCAWFQPGSVESDRCIYRIMYELADAVNYLHNKSIKHKDIKPENILLYREGSAAEVTPLITDFGVSKVFTKDARTNYTLSTMIYLAPEQWDRKSSTLKADVWQLGCCFAELLAFAGGGESAHVKLVNSYMRSADGNCSYSIAKEYSQFMGALGKICMRGNSMLRRVYGIVTGMLDLDPSQRLDIDWVRATLSSLPGLARA